MYAFCQKRGLEDFFDGEDFIYSQDLWFEIEEVEPVLERLETVLSGIYPGENLMEKVAYEAPQLKSWGDLDHVLLLSKNPLGIFSNPETLFANFLSPLPSMATLKSTENKTHSFHWPFSPADYPSVSEYLRCVLEVTPVFMGKEPATCTLSKDRAKIQWETKQQSLFVVEGQLKPELLKDLARKPPESLNSEERHEQVKLLGDLIQTANQFSSQLEQLKKKFEQSL